MIEQFRLEMDAVMNPRYPINVFWSDEDGSWIADVPDLRYCSAHGGTAAEAEEAMALWLVARDEGIAIPEPTYRPAPRADKAAA